MFEMYKSKPKDDLRLRELATLILELEWYKQKWLIGWKYTLPLTSIAGVEKKYLVFNPEIAGCAKVGLLTVVPAGGVAIWKWGIGEETTSADRAGCELLGLSEKQAMNCLRTPLAISPTPNDIAIALRRAASVPDVDDDDVVRGIWPRPEE